MNDIIEIWKGSLGRLLKFYEAHRGPLIIFFPLLFVFFVLVNIAFYWWAMVTAFPFLINPHYFRVQFPVGILGALFDSLSFFVTIFIIRRALRTKHWGEYVSHLSVDLLIAILATFWVVYVFSISGWIISFFEAAPQSLGARNDRYEQMLVDALEQPTDNLRNIYFGLIMGISAMFPTLIHIFMFLQACWRRAIGFRLSEGPAQ
ncbi:MAG: hypothetical protein R3264_11280 [Anaerolineae bacterium]|nr:hypothetical protein [Anaerolineae bacterium]